jgi:hypothetical protein
VATSIAINSFNSVDGAKAAGVPLLYGAVVTLLIGIWCLVAWKAGWSLAPRKDSIFRVVSNNYQATLDAPAAPDEPQQSTGAFLERETAAPARAAPRSIAAPVAAVSAVGMMADLSAMSVGDLRQRAASAGVAAQQIEDARDGDDPKGELIALITGAELGSMSVGDLRQRAASAGVPAQQIEDARDSDDPKSTLIALIRGQPPQMKSQSVPVMVAAYSPPAAVAPVVNVNIAASLGVTGGALDNKCWVSCVWILGIIYVRASCGGDPAGVWLSVVCHMFAAPHRL